MLLFKIILILFCSILTSCRSEIQFYLTNRFDNAIEQLMDTLSNCETQKRHFVTLLTDVKKPIDLSSKLFHIFTFLKIQISKDNNLEIFDHDIKQKTDIILAIISSPINLKYFLTKLKKSKWWNIYGLYLIVDVKTFEGNCDRADDFLQIIWKQDILSTTYICINSNDEIMMYTYNPYTNWALKEWKEVRKISSDVTSNDNWTLYEQKFVNNKTTCSNLDFPKTLTLGGQEIKAIGIYYPLSLEINPNKTGYESYQGFDGLIAKALWKKLNASLKVTLSNAQSFFDYSGSKKLSNLSIFDIINSGKMDILLNSQYIFNKYEKATFTYCHTETGLSLLTRNAGYETGPSKILHFMNPKLIIGTILVFCFTIIILRILRKEEIISAFLEVLRIAIGVAIVRTAKKISLRIYLITVIVLFLITGATFQGSLSSLLTSPVQKPNINSIDDVNKYNYKVYISKVYQNVSINENTRSRLIFVDHWNCTKHVLEEDNVGCSAERMRLTKIAYEYNLRVSKHRLIHLYSAYAVRPNWPLTDRVSIILLRMLESGLINHWITETAFNYKPEWLFKDYKIFQSNNYRSLTLIDLEFVFCILLFGYVISIFVFFIELFHLCERKSDVRKN